MAALDLILQGFVVVELICKDSSVPFNHSSHREILSDETRKQSGVTLKIESGMICCVIIQGVVKSRNVCTIQ